MAVLERDSSWPFNNCPHSNLKVAEGAPKLQAIAAAIAKVLYYLVAKSLVVHTNDFRLPYIHRMGTIEGTTLVAIVPNQIATITSPNFALAATLKFHEA